MVVDNFHVMGAISPPGDRLTIDDAKNLIVEVRAERSAARG
jgi:hypothetical protein